MEGRGRRRDVEDFSRFPPQLASRKKSSTGICRFAGIFHWKKCPTTRFPTGREFFLDSENSVTPCSPCDGWHWYLCDREAQIFFIFFFFFFFFLFLGDNSSCRDSRVFERFVILLANLLFGYLLWLVKLIKSDDYWYIF